jgi:hypothetical protein
VTEVMEPERTNLCCWPELRVALWTAAQGFVRSLTDWPHPFLRHLCRYPVTMPAKASARRSTFSSCTRSDIIEPSEAGNTRPDGEAFMARRRKGTSSVAMGMTSACPPLVVSRSYERATVKSRFSRSTSDFRRPKSSPFRRPVYRAVAKRSRQRGGKAASTRSTSSNRR